MNIGVSSKGEIKKDRKTILREEKLKEEKKRETKEKNKKLVEVRKTEGGELLREIVVKIGLERIDIQKGIMVEV